GGGEGFLGKLGMGGAEELAGAFEPVNGAPQLRARRRSSGTLAILGSTWEHLGAACTGESGYKGAMDDELWNELKARRARMKELLSVDTELHGNGGRGSALLLFSA